MAYIAAVLLMNMPEEQAFWAFYVMMESQDHFAGAISPLFPYLAWPCRAAVTLPRATIWPPLQPPRVVAPRCCQRCLSCSLPQRRLSDLGLIQVLANRGCGAINASLGISLGIFHLCLSHPLTLFFLYLYISLSRVVCMSPPPPPSQFHGHCAGFFSENLGRVQHEAAIFEEVVALHIPELSAHMKNMGEYMP